MIIFVLRTHKSFFFLKEARGVGDEGSPPEFIPRIPDRAGNMEVLVPEHIQYRGLSLE